MICKRLDYDMMSQTTYLLIFGIWFFTGCAYALVVSLLMIKEFVAARRIFSETGQNLTWVSFSYSGEIRRRIRDIAPEQACHLFRIRLSSWIFGPIWLAAFMLIMVIGSQ